MSSTSASSSMVLKKVEVSKAVRSEVRKILKENISDKEFPETIEIQDKFTTGSKEEKRQIVNILADKLFKEDGKVEVTEDKTEVDKFIESDREEDEEEREEEKKEISAVKDERPEEVIKLLKPNVIQKVDDKGKKPEYKEPVKLMLLRPDTSKVANENKESQSFNNTSIKILKPSRDNSEEETRNLKSNSFPAQVNEKLSFFSPRGPSDSFKDAKDPPQRSFSVVRLNLNLFQITVIILLVIIIFISVSILLSLFRIEELLESRNL